MGNLFVLHLFFIHTTIYLYQCETHGYLFYILGYCCCSANPVVSNPLQPHGQQHTRPLCPSPSPEVCPSSCPLHQWCHPAISSSDALFSFCPQSFAASGTLAMSQMFTSDDQNTGVSASASIFPMSILGWFLLRLTGLILQSKGLSRVFSNIKGLSLTSHILKLLLFSTSPGSHRVLPRF